MSSKPIIVVIEDDAISADALTLILQDWGAAVVSAQNVSEAIDRLGADIARVAHIITDFNLNAEEDGVAGAMRMMHYARKARVLVLSGSFKGRAAERAKAAGFAVMTKPAEAVAIIAWLEAA